MAVLHVHELEAGPLRENGGPHVVVGEAVEILVGQDPHAAGEAPVEDRVGEGDERLRPIPGARARVAARVCDLQAHHEVVGGALAEARLVGRDEVVAQARQRLPGRGADHELAGVRAAVVAHRGRLAAPDELRAGEAEVPPAAAGQLGRVAVGRAVPALHGQDAEAVAGAQAVGLERAGEGGVGGRRERVVEGERDAARLEVPAEGLGGAERRDANPAWIRHVRAPGLGGGGLGMSRGAGLPGGFRKRKPGGSALVCGSPGGAQKISRTPSWMLRGCPVIPVIRPKFAEREVRVGVAPVHHVEGVEEVGLDLRASRRR